MTQLPPPTDDVAVLVDLLGPETALRLIEARGGARVYVGGLTEGAVLAEIVGLDGAAALRSRYGATQIKIPIARPWRVLCYLAQGLSRDKAALRAGCSLNTVDRTVKNFGHPNGRASVTRAAGSQLDLFNTTSEPA